MEEQVIETWAIHNRIHLYLLEGIPEDHLGSSIPPKGRNVFDLFAHIHNVRLMWLKVAAPDLWEGLQKIESKEGTREQLREALTASSVAVETLLRKGLAAGGKIKNFKPHAVAFMGYLISHESHHRGQIGWALKYSGHPLDKKIAFGLWEWGTR